MQPNAEDRRRIIKPKTIENDFPEIKLPKPRKDRMPEILGSFLQDILNDENSGGADRFSPNTKMYEMIQAANAKRNTPIDSNHIETTCSSSNQISASSSSAQSMLIDESLIKTPAKSSSNETVMPVSGSNRSRRKTMIHAINYSELSDDDHDTSKGGSARKTASKKTVNRRRTLFPSTSSDASAISSALDMSITNSISTMNISPTITSPKKQLAKTTNRRKTTHNVSAMDVTLSQANKTSDNNQISLSSSLTQCVTPSSKRPTINQITNNDQFKTPPHSNIGTVSMTAKSTGRKKTSPLIKSVLRRRTMHSSALIQTPVSTVTPPIVTLPSSVSATKNTRRRTLFTPNKLVEISKNMEMGSRDQLDENDTINGKFIDCV